MSREICKECKWLNGRKCSVGVECMQPQNQEKWNAVDEERLKYGWLPRTTRYKQPSGKACRKFQPMRKPSNDIVHCKDCKYLRYCETEDLDLYLDCDCPDGGGIPRNEDWYCADGERIEK